MRTPEGQADPSTPARPLPPPAVGRTDAVPGRSPRPCGHRGRCAPSRRPLGGAGRKGHAETLRGPPLSHSLWPGGSRPPPLSRRAGLACPREWLTGSRGLAPGAEPWAGPAGKPGGRGRGTRWRSIVHTGTPHRAPSGAPRAVTGSPAWGSFAAGSGPSRFPPGKCAGTEAAETACRPPRCWAGKRSTNQRPGTHCRSELRRVREKRPSLAIKHPWEEIYQVQGTKQHPTPH